MKRDLIHPKDVTLPILERYQRYLYHDRSPTAPRSLRQSADPAGSLEGFFQWAARSDISLQPGIRVAVARLPGVCRTTSSPSPTSTASSISRTSPPLGSTRSGLLENPLLERDPPHGAGAPVSLRCRHPRLLTHRACGKRGRDRVVPLGERAGSLARSIPRGSGARCSLPGTMRVCAS